MLVGVRRVPRLNYFGKYFLAVNQMLEVNPKVSLGGKETGGKIGQFVREQRLPDHVSNSASTGERVPKGNTVVHTHTRARMKLISGGLLGTRILWWSNFCGGFFLFF